jgi:hypothetical protein
MSRVTTRDLPLSSTLILVCIQTKFDVIPVQNFQLPVKGNFKIWPFIEHRTVATGVCVGGEGGLQHPLIIAHEQFQVDMQ